MKWSLVGYIAGTAMQQAMGFVAEEPLGLPVVVALGRAEKVYRLRIRFQLELESRSMLQGVDIGRELGSPIEVCLELLVD